MAVQIGDKVPEFLGTDQDGKEVKMSDYKGKKVALYFYPKDNTSGCTAEACSLRDGYQALQAKGFEIIGVSKDSAKSHQGFIQKQNLSQNRNFPSASSLIRIRPCNSSSGFGQKRNCTDVHTWGLSGPPLSLTRKVLLLISSGRKR